MRWSVTALNFVLCPRFHGATALGVLLNNHSKVSSLGDMFPSSEFDQSCGCGKKVSQCPFWQLLERKFAAMVNRGPGVLYPAWPQVLSRRSVNDALVNTATLLALHTTPRVWRLLGRSAERFIGFYLDFVRTVNEYNDTSVFVNGQKSLKSVLALKSILGDRAQVNIVHLVRIPAVSIVPRRKPTRTSASTFRRDDGIPIIGGLKGWCGRSRMPDISPCSTRTCASSRSRR